jgi:hypothetical protein
MEHIILNAETGEITVVPFTPEEEAVTLAAAAPAESPKPTLEDLQAQLAALSAQIAALAGAAT